MQPIITYAKRFEIRMVLTLVGISKQRQQTTDSPSVSSATECNNFRYEVAQVAEEAK